VSKNLRPFGLEFFNPALGRRGPFAVLRHRLSTIRNGLKRDAIHGSSSPGAQ
jgi:hypothetical protein